MSTENNIYQAPEADVTPEVEAGDFVLHPARSRGAGAGWRWFKGGYSLLNQGIGVSIGMLLVYLVIMFILNLIPFVNFIATLIGPVFTAGFIMAAHRAHTEEKIEFGDLFAGFRNKLGTLMFAGLLYLLALLACGLFAGLLAGLSGGALTELFSSGSFSSGLEASSVLLFVLVGIALGMPIFMMIWFAPALIILHDQSAVNALKLSFWGCLKNILPFLIYGIVALIVILISAIPLGIGLLFTLPAFFYSSYKAYRDIYIDHELA